MSAIDLNRGVTIKMDPNTGARVSMYKDQPGVFLNQHGAEVADSLAARCGFPVKDLMRERRKREAIAVSSAQIEEQFEEQMAVKTKTKVIAETDDGYRVEQKPFGRCWVYGPDDKTLNDRPLTKEEALHLFKVIRDTPERAVSTPVENAGTNSETVADQIEAGAPASSKKGDADGT